mmetsp:Transcript_1839/g.5363  ORF Transcript_1839/g.5363 Transcript_1839/m.5363 type:complete len:189 (-) Transcript_1839:852-1418(-)
MGDRIWEADPDEVHEEKAEKPVNHAYDHVVFLVDARAPMQARSATGQSYFACALEAFVATLKRRVLQGNHRDHVGLFVFGTADDNESDGFDNVKKLLPLKVPGKDTILAARRVAAAPAPEPATECECPLYGALECAMQAFRDAKTTGVKKSDNRCTSRFDPYPSFFKPYHSPHPETVQPHLQNPNAKR